MFLYSSKTESELDSTLYSTYENYRRIDSSHKVNLADRNGGEGWLEGEGQAWL